MGHAGVKPSWWQTKWWVWLGLELCVRWVQGFLTAELSASAIAALASCEVLLPCCGADQVQHAVRAPTRITHAPDAAVTGLSGQRTSSGLVSMLVGPCLGNS